MKHRDWLWSSPNNSSISALTAPRRRLWFPNPNDRGMLGFSDLDPASGPACALSCFSHARFSPGSPVPPPHNQKHFNFSFGPWLSSFQAVLWLLTGIFRMRWSSYTCSHVTDEISPCQRCKQRFSSVCSAVFLFLFLRNKGNYNDHIFSMSMNSCLGNFLNTGEKIISTLSCHFCLKMSGILMVDDMFVS